MFPSQSIDTDIDIEYWICTVHVCIKSLLSPGCCCCCCCCHLLTLAALICSFLNRSRGIISTSLAFSIWRRTQTHAHTHARTHTHTHTHTHNITDQQVKITQNIAVKWQTLTVLWVIGATLSEATRIILTNWLKEIVPITITTFAG